MHACLILLCVYPTFDGKEALDAMQVRLEKLGNIRVEYTFSEVYPPQALILAMIQARNDTGNENVPANGGRGTNLMLMSDTKTGVGRFRFAGGATRFERELPSEGRRIQSFVGDRYESLYNHQVGATQGFSGTIGNADSESLPGDSVIDSALGMRLLNANQWLTPESLVSTGVETWEEDGAIQMRLRDQSPSNISHVWTVDPLNAYRITKYRIQTPSISNPASGEKVTFSEMENSDFIEVDGIDLPRRIEWRRYFHAENGARHRNLKVTIDVKQYQINDASNSKESMRIVWPTDTQITDTRTDAMLTVVGEPHAIDDAALTRAASRLNESQNDKERPDVKGWLGMPILLIGSMGLIAIVGAWFLVRIRRKSHAIRR